MNALTFIALSLAGGLGAGLRLLTDAWVRSRTTGNLPLGTVLINILGSFLLGIMVGAAPAAGLTFGAQSIISIGLLGGFTTLSTMSFETVALLREGRLGAALGHGLGTLVAAIAAAALGIVVGGAL